MIQFSSFAATYKNQWNMWLIKVLSVIYFIAVCTAQDPEEAVTDTTDFGTEPPIVTPTIYEPPVPTLQLQTAWLDVFPSEEVEFNCSVPDSSDWTFRWSRGQHDLPSEGPVLTISAEKEKSGSYSCKGHHKTKHVTTAPSNSLTLQVYESKPKAIVRQSSNFAEMFPGEAITFTCMVDESTGWEYMWYHNKKEIQAATSNTYTIGSIDHSHSGQYHCNAKRGKGPFITQESETKTLQVVDPPKPDMKLQTPWMDVFKGESVEFKCGLNSSDWTFTWSKDLNPLQEDEVLILEDALLNITSITPDYQGVYACKGSHKSRKVSSEFSNTVKITVYDHTPKATLSKAPLLNTMYVGETVNLTCNVDVSSGWEYHWYKDQKAFRETSKTMSVHLDISSEGKYSCKATRKVTSTDSSDEIQQHVIEIPVPSLKPLTSWLDVFPGESVKLRCGMSDSSGWTYKWHKDGQEVQADGVVSFESNGAILSIDSASAAHKGQYKCKGDLNDRSVNSDFSPGLDLTVYDKKPSVKLTQDPDYELMFPGESVSFSCHINVSSGWEYLWFKDGQSLEISGNKSQISSVETDNSGSYKCQAKRGENRVFLADSSKAVRFTVEENRPKPLMTQQPDADKVYTGESVSFECKVKLSSGWQYLWYKDEAQLLNSSSLNIASASGLNNGTYKCMAKRDKTKYLTEYSAQRTLHIFEIPVPSLKLLTPWLDVFPGESVKLSCGMDGSSDWKYIWYKDGEEVQDGNAVSFDRDRSTLSISSASPSHHGQYTCSAKLKTRHVSSTFSSGLTLKVYDTKPKVTLMQNPSHNVMHTEDSVSFSCHINVSSGWEYLWFKDGTPLVESGNNHNITSVLIKDTGSYICQTKREGATAFHSDMSLAVKLDIQERPKAYIVLLTGWSKVFSTDSLELKCGLPDSQDMWNYTWFKGGQPINLTPSEIHIVTPQDDPEQSLYTCQGIRNGRPAYSKKSDDFKTKNLLLKRRVLLSISGCILSGIILVFLGCIVLRVIRKPATDDYKPEDADLFPRMINPINLDDTPCPLVQYITDAALNASPKEGDENGTICSETTPLPITSQEEQAVTTEGHDASENNGGLVSFKQ